MGKYICYCPAFDLIWSTSPWIGEGEYWAKMCQGNSRNGSPTFWWFCNLYRLTFPVVDHRLVIEGYAFEYYRGLMKNFYRWPSLYSGKKIIDIPKKFV